jgi:two-component system sensor histidine kinase KdpD
MTDGWTPRGLSLAAGGALAALAAASGVVWLLESWLGLTDASAAYLLAVVAIAVLVGTLPALVTAAGAFAAYNFLFTHPRFTFEVADSGQLLNLVLLLIVGVVVGQLAGTQGSRVRSAEAREREARALFEISRSLATSSSIPALRRIMETLVADARLEAAWVAVGSSPGAERPLTDAPAGAPPPSAAHFVLQRGTPPDDVRWMAIRPPGSPPRDARFELQAYRVPLEVAGRPVGGLWALRRSARGNPTREEARTLAAAADQIGQALEQERLRVEATSAEVARRSEQLKSVLLESVSHDLRTPLAAIRAAAGTLMDAPEVPDAERVEVARSIDGEAERMDRLVGNLLEISRIEAGGLTVDLQSYALDDLLAETLRRLVRGDGPELRLEVPDALPYVRVDAVLLDQVVANVVENAQRHAAGAATRMAATAEGDQVRLVIEDGGPGVPSEALAHLFEKFYRVPGRERRGTRGVGLGLAVSHGLVEAMGGRIKAGVSSLGGLMITIWLPAAQPPPEEGTHS